MFRRGTGPSLPSLGSKILDLGADHNFSRHRRNRRPGDLFRSLRTQEHGRAADLFHGSELFRQLPLPHHRGSRFRGHVISSSYQGSAPRRAVSAHSPADRIAGDRLCAVSMRCFAKADNPVLRRNAGGFERRSLSPRRGDIHDPAPAAFPHMRQCSGVGVESGRQVDPMI